MASGRILVVDDEESVAITMAAILELDGYVVTTATRGSQAIELIRAQTFDLVLTDLRLDDLDGIAIVGEVCRGSPDTIVIVLTGYASLESAIKALREGAYDYLVKPCNVEELKATVGRGIERRQLGLQLRARVDELEQANQTISAMNSSLQRRIDDATAQLQQRMEELASANELKSRFLSMASHELKTPLTSIVVLTQLLARRIERRLEQGHAGPAEWENEAQADLRRLADLKSQTMRLARLVDDLLDVSRIESGRIHLNVAPLDLTEVVADVVNRTRLATSSHELVLDPPPPNGTIIQGDRDRLEQVVENLLANAIKYAPGDSQVRLALSLASTDHLWLTVRDQGPGIAADQIESVFELFHRGEDAPTAIGGLGLGLYICREIVDRHGGKIWAESEPGQGATFVVSLPRFTADPSSNGAP